MSCCLGQAEPLLRWGGGAPSSQQTPQIPFAHLISDWRDSTLSRPVPPKKIQQSWYHPNLETGQPVISALGYEDNKRQSARQDCSSLHIFNSCSHFWKCSAVSINTKRSGYPVQPTDASYCPFFGKSKMTLKQVFSAGMIGFIWIYLFTDQKTNLWGQLSQLFH